MVRVKMRNMLMRCSFTLMLVYALAACSHTDSTVIKTAYHITATQAPAVSSQNISSLKSLASAKNTSDTLTLLETSKTAPVLAVTKKDPKSLGNIYLPNAFSTNQEELVLEIKRVNKGYKASTPFLFDSPSFNSRLAFSVNASTAVTAGLEFTIPLGKNK